MKNELISIITPVYNDQQWLPACVQSIRTQTYQNWELLIIDDGSNDQTAAIARQLQNTDHRIHYYHLAHQGVGAARNAGLRLAHGNLVCFIDGDDWIQPDYLARLSQELWDNQADVAVVNFYECDQYRHTFDLHLTNSPAEQRLERCYTAREWLAQEGNTTAELNFVFDTSWCKLFKKALFHFVSYPHTIPEDDRTNWKAYAAARRIVYCNWPGYVYRINKPDSLTVVTNRATFFHVEPTETHLAIYHLGGVNTTHPLSKYRHRLKRLADNPLMVQDRFHYLDTRFKLHLLNHFKH